MPSQCDLLKSVTNVDVPWLKRFLGNHQIWPICRCGIVWSAPSLGIGWESQFGGLKKGFAVQVVFMQAYRWLIQRALIKVRSKDLGGRDERVQHREKMP